MIVDTIIYLVIDMKRFSFYCLAIVLTLILSGCAVEQSNSNPLDVSETTEVPDKTPEDWLELVSRASEENDSIGDYLPTLTCLPVTSKACEAEGRCKDAEPSNFLFITSFDTRNSSTLSVTRNVYRCNELNGCERREYAYFSDKNEGVEKLQYKDNEISIDSDNNYVDSSVVGVNIVSNSGTCYYRDELAIAQTKVETNNVFDSICEIEESHFGIDWVGVSEQFTLSKKTELRASPIEMDCNILDYVPAGESIFIQTDTNGANNGADPYVWLKISYNGQTGWIRGDYVDQQFLLE